MMSEDRDNDSVAERGSDPAAPPRVDEKHTFEAPWQARAFATVVALHHEGAFEWREFQARLIDEIQRESADNTGTGSNRGYYAKWLTAAEKLLSKKGIVDPDILEQRSEEFLTGERDASEFVVGVDHVHNHTHRHHDHD